MNRLLVLTELFLPTKGGTAVWAAEVYKRLGGKEIHIVTADVPGAAEVDATHPNTIHRLESQARAMAATRVAGDVLRAFSSSRWRWRSPTASMPSMPFARCPKAWWRGPWRGSRFGRVVIYAHGEELTTWGRGGKYKAMRFALRHADRVIANSEHTRDTLLEMGIDPAANHDHLSGRRRVGVPAWTGHHRLARKPRHPRRRKAGILGRPAVAPQGLRPDDPCSGAVA